MEKRTRTRIGTRGRTAVLIRGFDGKPVPVTDFSLSGMSIGLNGQSGEVSVGQRLDMDVLVGGAIHACGMTGTVRWTGDGRAGISLDMDADWKGAAAIRLETGLCRP